MKKIYLKSIIAGAVLAGLSQQALAVDTTFTPTDDTWIQSSGVKQFHTVDSIRIDKGLKGYVKFDVVIPVGQQITSAILRLTASVNNDIPDAFVQKASDPGEVWTEDTINGDTNDLIADGTIIPAGSNIAKDTTHDFDVSVEFQGENATTDQAVTFLLDMVNTDIANVRFYSSDNEDASLHPQLIITTEVSAGGGGGGGDDTTPPTFADNIPAIDINATGLTTDVSSLISITADDETDAEPIQSVIEGTRFLPSGINTVTLKATDTAGNSATKDITVNIIPQTALSTSDGILNALVDTNLPITVKLLGEAASYPVTLDYTLTGEAVADSAETLTFEDATEQTVDVNILAGAGHLQTATFTIIAANNAQIPVNDSLTIRAIAGNIAPALVGLELSQNGALIATIDSNNQNGVYTIDGTAGPVTVMANVKDINGDELTVSWQGSSASLNAQGSQFEIDPENISGELTLNAMATESGGEALDSNVLIAKIRITTEALTPLLDVDENNEIVDSDGDGISDKVEGFNDSDGDGIVDYLDNNADIKQLPLADNDKPLQTIEGLRLTLGSISTAAKGFNAKSALISFDELTNNVSEGSESTAVNSFIPVENASLLNFKVKGLVNGTAAPIVYPLPSDVAISENTVYQKYTPAAGWNVFTAQGENSIKSAKQDGEGNCPAPLDASYIDGLNVGDNCLQLTIIDGGLYDADGLENGSVEDPGILAVPNSAPTWNNDLLTINPVISNEGQSTPVDINLTNLASDAEGETLTYSKVSGSDAATVNEEGILTIDYNSLTGEHSVIVNVSDGNFTPAEMTVSFSATINSAPTITASELPTASQNVVYSASIAEQISDAEGDSYTVTKIDGPHWLEVSETGELSGTPRNADIGTTVVNIEVTDSEGATSAASLNVLVEESAVKASKAGSFSGVLFTLLALISFGRRRQK